VRRLGDVELEKIDINGINDIYTLSVVKKEFRKAVDEPWKGVPPWQRYQKKLIQDLAVLDMEKEQAVDLAQYEKLSGEDNLYSIRHPESKKNVRIIYTIMDNVVILLIAFLEKNDGDYQKAKNTAKKRIKWLEDK
jgi:mRNA-degrading endonuclease RelE of RelBE toxin-antitoxin system